MILAGVFAEHALVSSEKEKKSFGQIQWRPEALYICGASCSLGYTAPSTLAVVILGDRMPRRATGDEGIHSKDDGWRIWLWATQEQGSFLDV